MPEIKSVALPVSLSGRGLRVLYTAARYRPQAQATGFLLRECGRQEALSQHSLHLYGIRRPFGRQAVVDRGQAFPCVMPRAPALCVISVLEHVLHDLHARPCVCVLPSFFVCFLSCWEACGVRHGMRYLCAARGAGGPGFCRGTFGCSGEKNAQRGDAGFALYLPEAGHGSAPGRADGLLCVAGRACRSPVLVSDPPRSEKRCLTRKGRPFRDGL